MSQWFRWVTLALILGFTLTTTALGFTWRTSSPSTSDSDVLVVAKATKKKAKRKATKRKAKKKATKKKATKKKAKRKATKKKGFSKARAKAGSKASNNAAFNR